MKLSYDNLIEIGIIFLIVFTPIVFGSVGLGPQIVLITISEFIFLLFLLKSASSGLPVFKNNIFSVVFFAFLVLIVFQFIPLPKFLLKLLSPATYKIYMDFMPGYGENHMWRAISVYPIATQAEFFKILSCGLMVFVTIDTIKTREQIIRIITAIVITGFSIAIFGIIQRFTWNGMIYWVQPVPERVMAFGPFVNKNHFAGFMELTIPITAAFIFITNRIEKKVLFGFMATVMLLALFLSLSRAGIVSFFASLAILSLIIFSRKHLKKYIFYILLAAALTSILIFFINKASLIERFSTVPEAIQSRWQIYRDIFRMFLDFPLFGIGLGNFANIFPMYKTIVGNLTFSHADSDCLQFLSETGLIGFLSIVIFIWLFFKEVLYSHFLGKGSCILSKGINLPPYESKRHDRFVLLVISACLVSIVSIILHGMVDVNLHIPSNAILTFIIGSLSMIAAHTKFKENDNR